MTKGPRSVTEIAQSASSKGWRGGPSVTVRRKVARVRHAWSSGSPILERTGFLGTSTPSRRTTGFRLLDPDLLAPDLPAHAQSSSHARSPPARHSSTTGRRVDVERRQSRRSPSSAPAQPPAGLVTGLEVTGVVVTCTACSGGVTRSGPSPSLGTVMLGTVMLGTGVLAVGGGAAFVVVFGVFLAALVVLAVVTLRWAVRRDRKGRAEWAARSSAAAAQAQVESALAGRSNGHAPRRPGQGARRPGQGPRRPGQGPRRTGRDRKPGRRGAPGEGGAPGAGGSPRRRDPRAGR